MLAINQIKPLIDEGYAIDAALTCLQGGGPIVAMMIGWPAPQAGREPVTVSTVGVAYPPQMVTAITTALTERRDAIIKELAALGVEVPA